MSIAFKFVSLGIRTLAKPIGNYIKSQAREHDRFRRTCVAFAQTVHRIDMRMRLGLLQDPAVIERQIKREQEELERKRNPDQPATAKTKEETEADKKEKEEIRKKLKNSKRRIKPLSESKAIDSGATFISETFLFMVAGGLILWESWRRDRKEGRSRDEVQARLEKLEGHIEGLERENRTLRTDIEQRNWKIDVSRAKTSSSDQTIQRPKNGKGGDKDMGNEVKDTK